ncbi:MAG TPA: endonuclease/exonuclease/phosphatase family protein [Vicinamibacterales bacterium]
MVGEHGFEPPAIRLLTLNAHQGFNAFRRRKLLSCIRDALRASGADLVFLQEVGGDHGEDIPQQHYDLLADQVWPQHAYGRNAVATSGHQGNALLSKFPIVRWQNVDVSVDGVEPRGMLHCVLDVQQAGPPLHAVCVHLGLREAQRRWQVDRLLALVADAIPRDAPLVIAGDFNDWRERAHRRMLADPSLAEIHASASKRPARTFPAWWPWLRLDRIYVRNLHHRPLEMPRRPWSELSDHAPLAGEIRLGATRAPGPRSGR